MAVRSPKGSTGEVKVPTEHELTFYTRHGELFAKSCAVVTLIAHCPLNGFYEIVMTSATANACLLSARHGRDYAYCIARISAL